jgi:hypothetical protein
MTTVIRYPKGYQFFDANGDPLASGALSYFQAGTTTPADTYSDAAGTVPNTNPVELDAAGRLTVAVYLGDAANYKEVLTARGATVHPWPDDNIPQAAEAGVMDVFTGDSGSGGTAGLVPAPEAGDTAAGKFLKADGTWTAPAGVEGGMVYPGAGLPVSTGAAWGTSITPGTGVAAALAIAVDGAGGLASKNSLGTAAAKDIPATGNASTSQVVYGTDTRLSNGRTPTAHAASHAAAGGDALSLAASQVSGIPASLASQNIDGVARLGIGTTDTNNVLSVAGATSLFSNSAGGVQVSLSKHAAGDTASYVFQDNFSGRAEFGLCGDDNFTMKVSADGSTWNNGLVINKTSGAVSLPNSAGFTGDTGSGGSVGLVPAPAAGDTAAGKYLKADGTWAAPSGGGGSMVYPGAGVPVSTGSAWASSITLGTGVATALAANVTGSGGPVLATAPTITGQVLAAGTATVAPQTMTAGTNLTTPVAGACEYDGYAPYFSPVAGVRGVVPAYQYSIVTNSAGKALNNDTNAQSFLPTGTQNFPVEAGAIYRFRAKVLLNTGNSNSRTVSSLFATGGGAAFSWISYSTKAYGSTSMGNMNFDWVSVMNAASARTMTSFNSYVWYELQIEGEFVMSSGGTIQPQIQFSAAPGGTNTSVQGTYFELYPMGANAASAGLS